MRALSSRERLLIVLNNGKPDHLPCQVHGWMTYYIKTYLGVSDQYEAYARFPGIDWVIYLDPAFVYDPHDLADWQVKITDLGQDESGNQNWLQEIHTPEGSLFRRRSGNEFTCWDTEHLIKSEHDFELWSKYVPVPIAVDWTPVIEAKRRIGERGIVRGGFWGFGQGSPWQDWCILRGTQPAIMDTFDRPEWVHYALETMLTKKLRVIELAGCFELDLVETGGGAGSSTVISPTIQREFCVPYDRRQHAALHAAGVKVVYHLCGGVMPFLDFVVQNGADGLETMTPPRWVAIATWPRPTGGLATVSFSSAGLIKIAALSTVPLKSPLSWYASALPLARMVAMSARLLIISSMAIWPTFRPLLTKRTVVFIDE